MHLENILFYVIFFFILFLWIRWRKQKLSLFAKYKIPGPTPHFLFGNIIELNKKGPYESHKAWIKEYGEIVGYYHGMKPVLLVADPDLLRKIFIKDFHLFSDRPESIPLRVHTFLDFFIPASKIMDTIITNLKGERWKIVRKILSTTFSANKLKTMIPALNELSALSTSILEEKCHNDETIDIYKHMQCLTLDVICAQAFAMNVDLLRNPDHSFLHSAKIIFRLSYSSKIVFFGRCFPEFSFFTMMLSFIKMFIVNKGRIPPLTITNVLEKIIKLRRENPAMRKPDLLQLLIDASSDENENLDGGTFQNVNKPFRKITLSDLEVKSNALVVLLAGFETTSVLLGCAFHFLALYPDMQKKIQKEIDQTINSQEKVDYYSVTNFQFMDRFLLETMRFYPPGSFFVSRIALAEVDYGYVRIPKGVQVEVPVHYIHYSTDFWHDPEVFDPDRFLPENTTENHTVRYWAFGVGPRNCIGTRLVHLTTKIILAKILQKFSVHPATAQSKMNIPIKFKFTTIEPMAVPVKLKLRQKEE